MSPLIQTYLAVMLGGALGTGMRMFLAEVMSNRFGESFPWGIIAVNVSGCFFIGIFSGLTGPDGVFAPSPITRQVVMVGVLGGYTTFSSFSLRTITLLSEGEWLYAFGNISLTVLLCLIGTWGGLVGAGLWQAR